MSAYETKVFCILIQKSYHIWYQNLFLCTLLFVRSIFDKPPGAHLARWRLLAHYSSLRPAHPHTHRYKKKLYKKPIYALAEIRANLSPLTQFLYWLELFLFCSFGSVYISIDRKVILIAFVFCDCRTVLLALALALFSCHFSCQLSLVSFVVVIFRRRCVPHMWWEERGNFMGLRAPLSFTKQLDTV